MKIVREPTLCLAKSNSLLIRPKKNAECSTYRDPGRVVKKKILAIWIEVLSQKVVWVVVLLYLGENEVPSKVIAC